MNLPVKKVFLVTDNYILNGVQSAIIKIAATMSLFCVHSILLFYDKIIKEKWSITFTSNLACNLSQQTNLGLDDFVSLAH